MKVQKITSRQILRNLIAVLLIMISVAVQAQKYVLSKGVITFFSEAAIEDIKATNKKSSSIFNSSTGKIAFAIPINEFQFNKKLMQEHFNEKYMESDKYPRSTFSGKLSGFNKDAAGKQNVNASGKLTIHGVTKEINVSGVVERDSEGLSMNSKFVIKLADYKIKIPQLLWQNIAEEVEVTLDLHYVHQ